MPSGKQSRRQRQVQVPRPPSAARARRASPRVLAIAGGAVALVIVGIVLAIALGGGDDSSTADVPTRGSLDGALPGAREIEQMLAGIPQDGNTLGAASAPVTMVEYVDVQCPYCREFELEVVPALVERYVREGKLRIEERPLAFIGPDSERGRDASVAAGLQSKLFNYVHLLFLNQGVENSGWVDDELVTAIAASIPGLDVPRLLDERDSAAVDEQNDGFDSQASTDQVSSTPTILVGPTGGTLQRVTLATPDDEAAVVQAIENALP
jgi:protein-disulfide isomerase